MKKVLPVLHHICFSGFTPVLLFSLLLSFILIVPGVTVSAMTEEPSSGTILPAKSASFAFVVLSDYELTLDVGDEVYLVAITSDLSLAKFTSSSSSVAGVNTYGLITAKKAGTTKITAKIAGAEATCKVTVRKTTVSISCKNVTLENGATFRLAATSSTGHPVSWKSSALSIAAVDEDGYVTVKKPGTVTITASVDGGSATCKITVKLPTLRLSAYTVTLYRGQAYRLTCRSSSGLTPKWRTNKSSIAVVDPYGTITAVKNGSAIITVKLDGVYKLCQVIVKSPDITLSETSLTLAVGDTHQLTADVSSGNTPSWRSSNRNVIMVDANGKLTALKKGKAYVYASEDGTTVRCVVTITDPET